MASIFEGGSRLVFKRIEEGTGGWARDIARMMAKNNSQRSFSPFQEHEWSSILLKFVLPNGMYMYISIRVSILNYFLQRIDNNFQSKYIITFGLKNIVSNCKRNEMFDFILEWRKANCSMLSSLLLLRQKKRQWAHFDKQGRNTKYCGEEKRQDKRQERTISFWESIRIAHVCNGDPFAAGWEGQVSKPRWKKD